MKLFIVIIWYYGLIKKGDYMSSNAQIDIKEIITNQAMMAKKASQKLATLSSLEKNKALLTMAHALEVKLQLF